jgi:hypothetical protein
VEVPEGATNLRVVNPQNNCGKGLFFDMPTPANCVHMDFIVLPKADWQLLRSCTADKLSIEDAKIAMPGFSTRDYTSSASCSFAGPDAKLKSLLSLVRSQGYEPSKTVILLKQQSNNP